MTGRRKQDQMTEEIKQKILKCIHEEKLTNQQLFERFGYNHKALNKHGILTIPQRRRKPNAVPKEN